jgi:archaemetzincin
MDWLAVHPEDGQSFEAFRVAPRRQVTEARRVLRVLPLDDLAHAGADVPTITAYLAAFYGLPSEPGTATAPTTFTTRVNPSTSRTQVLTTDVLAWLPSERASTDYCVIALTTRDLYPAPSWNFVFGEAALFDGVGVFSFARMDPRFPWPPDPARRDAAEARLVKRRCLKVVSHEVGHMFGLEHCVARRCLLNGCNHVAEMDATPMHLCPACLRKVVHATGLDVDARYRALLACYRREGLDDEARKRHVRRLGDDAARVQEGEELGVGLVDNPKVRDVLGEPRAVLEKEIQDGVVGGPGVLRIVAGDVGVEDVDVVVEPLVALEPEDGAHEDGAVHVLDEEAPAGLQDPTALLEEGDRVRDVVDHVRLDDEVERRVVERRFEGVDVLHVQPLVVGEVGDDELRSVDDLAAQTGPCTELHAGGARLDELVHPVVAVLHDVLEVRRRPLEVARACAGAVAHVLHSVSVGGRLIAGSHGRYVSTAPQRIQSRDGEGDEPVQVCHGSWLSRDGGSP